MFQKVEEKMDNIGGGVNNFMPDIICFSFTGGAGRKGEEKSKEREEGKEGKVGKEKKMKKEGE